MARREKNRNSSLFLDRQKVLNNTLTSLKGLNYDGKVSSATRRRKISQALFHPSPSLLLPHYTLRAKRAFLTFPEKKEKERRERGGFPTILREGGGYGDIKPRRIGLRPDQSKRVTQAGTQTKEQQVS